MKLLITLFFLSFLGQASFSQVGIGTDNPDKSSILELSSDSKGLLIPRVNLTNDTMILSPGVTQAEGLIVYNSGSSLAKGFYYWNGGSWKSLVYQNAKPGTGGSDGSGGGGTGGDGSSGGSTSDGKMSMSTKVLSSKLVKTNYNGQPGYEAVMTTPDGLFSVRAFVPEGSTFNNVSLQLRYNGELATGDNINIMWNAHTVYSGGNVINAGNNFTLPGRDIWYGNNGDNAVSVAGNKMAAWGDQGAYYGGVPEQRDYIFTTNDPLNKVTYQFKYSFAVPGTGKQNTVVNDATADLARVYINLQQLKGIDTTPSDAIDSSDSIISGGTGADIQTKVVVSNFVKTNSNGASGYEVVINSPDNRFSVRVFITDKNPTYSDFRYSRIQLRYNVTIPVGETIGIMWNNHISKTGTVIGEGGNNFTIPFANTWYGNSGDTAQAVSNSNPWESWGTTEAYNPLTPQKREYTFSTNNPDDKTTYTLKFMMATKDPTAANLKTNDTNARNMKVYMYMQQITPK